MCVSGRVRSFLTSPPPSEGWNHPFPKPDETGHLQSRFLSQDNEGQSTEGVHPSGKSSRSRILVCEEV